MIEEYLETLHELLAVEKQLFEKQSRSLLNKKVKLLEKEKIYLKLSDIEITLSKIECHSNEQLKLMRFQTELVYHQLKLGVGINGKVNYNDKAFEKWWSRFDRISD